MKKQHLSLSASDEQSLKDLLSKGALAVRVHKRALGLQLLDQGMSYKSASSIVAVSAITLSKWAKAYQKEGLAMLYDKPRSGRPHSLSGEIHAKVIALACSDAPEGYGRWSFRLLADKLVELDIVDSISHTEVGRILKKMNFNLIAKNNGALAK